MGSVLNKNDEFEYRQQQTMEQLYLDKDETGDVTFIVGFEKIRAHKCVLAAVSPKYKAQFYGLLPDRGEIVVKDVSASAFEEFLEFFYLKSPGLTAANVEGVLSLAKQSLVEEFVEECISFLVKVNDASLIYRLAIMHDLKELEERCLSYISDEPMGVFQSDGFLNNYDLDMLLQITKMEFLNCKEIDIFEACISWAKNACIQKNIDANKADNLRTELGSVVNEIRFRSMTIEEFAHLHNKYEGFFTPDESIEIMYMIGNLKAFKSNKFNQNLRNGRLELNRIVQEEERKKLWIRIVPVTFLCNKAIRLRGFATGFNVVHNLYELRICITNNNGNCTEYKPNYTIKDESVVNFEKPIHIQANDRVTVNINIPSFEVSKKYALAREVELDDIKFSFDVESDAPGILITRLFFNI